MLAKKNLIKAAFLSGNYNLNFMKKTLILILFLLFSTISLKAQSKFEFWPQGHVDILADFKGGVYATIGGPNLGLIQSDRIKVGIQFAPSLRFMSNAPEGQEIIPLLGFGVFAMNPAKKIRYNLINYYDAPSKSWSTAFGLGYIINVQSK